MRRVTLSRQAEDNLAAQLQYLVDRGAHRAAEYLTQCVHHFLNATLAPFPRVGRLIPEQQLWEVRVARTRLLVWYEVSDDELRVVAFWHVAQDRANH